MKHDIENMKRSIKSAWWRLRYKNEMLAFFIVGSGYIVVGTIAYMIAR
jgi:hypothetical protein